MILVMTFARVYVNYESTNMYQRLFHRLFDTIEKRITKPVSWTHIHGKGFTAVVSDMDAKQIAGKSLLEPY